MYNDSVNEVQVHNVLLVWYLQVCLPFVYLQDVIFLPVYWKDKY